MMAALQTALFAGHSSPQDRSRLPRGGAARGRRGRPAGLRLVGRHTATGAARVPNSLVNKPVPALLRVAR